MNILDFFFPKRCVNCGRVGQYVCRDCRRKIRPILDSERICPMCGRLAFGGKTHPHCRSRYGIDGLTSFFHYEGVVQKAIKAIKYRFVSDVAKEFMELAPIPPFAHAVLIPIPLYPSRRRLRGFNQAEKLGTYMHIPMRTDILCRIKHTKPQAEMHKKERVENMKHAFVSRPVTGNVVLFDDVFTTGATMRSAGEALKRAGAKTIWAVTIAR